MEPDTKTIPKRGEKRWSGYFDSHVYLVDYIDDDHWTFQIGEHLPVYRAKTKWSTMAPYPPVPVSRR